MRWQNAAAGQVGPGYIRDLTEQVPGFPGLQGGRQGWFWGVGVRDTQYPWNACRTFSTGGLTLSSVGLPCLNHRPYNPLLR